jgi:hypothetical protein
MRGALVNGASNNDLLRTRTSILFPRGLENYEVEVGLSNAAPPFTKMSWPVSRLLAAAQNQRKKGNIDVRAIIE